MRPNMPLRLMNTKPLPKKLCDDSLNEISPTMSLMEDDPEIQINKNTIIDKNVIDKSFEHSLSNTKRIAQCMFLKDNWVNWKESCFCKMTKHSLIMKKGTESDKLRSEENNSKCDNKRKRK